MTYNSNVLPRAIRHQQPMFKIKSLPITCCLIERFLDERSVLGMGSLQYDLHCRFAGWIEFQNSKRFVLPDDMSTGNAPAETAGVAQLLRFSQIGLAASQIGGSFRHLHLEFVAGLTEFLHLRAEFVAQTRVLKRCGGVIGSHGKEQLVNLARKVGASGRRSDQASLGIEANGNDDTAAWLRAAKVGNDFLTRKLPDNAWVSLQPFGECFPCVPPHHFDCAAPSGIAQTHKGEIQLQRSDQNIGEPGGNDRRFSSTPRRRDCRECYQLSERRSQSESLNMGFYGHF